MTTLRRSALTLGLIAALGPRFREAPIKVQFDLGPDEDDRVAASPKSPREVAVERPRVQSMKARARR